MEPLYGFLIALVIGATGIGGGSLTAPLLILGLGRSPATAVAVAQLYSAAVKLPAASLYLARGRLRWGTLRALLTGGIAGLFFGLVLLQGLRNNKPLLLAVIGVVVLLSFPLGRWLRGRGASAADGEGVERRLALIGVPIGLTVGFSSSGAGTLGMAALLALTALPIDEAVGTDLWLGLVLSLLAGGINLASGLGEPALLLRLVAGGVPGALLGGWLATRLPAARLRPGVQLILAVNGAQLLWQGLSHAR